MHNFLLLVSIIFVLVVCIGFFNEKVTRLTDEIALLLFSAVVGCILTAIWAGVRSVNVRELLESVQVFHLNEYLVEGVLCFMLFAGSRNLKLRSFRANARKIGVLAFVCTLLGAVFYGGLFYLVCLLLHLPFTFPMCLMLGSIIAPTDPIAATSILKKFGLPEKVGFLMEAESLLNDGVGVALFVCFSGMVAGGSGSGFLLLMAREILGAVAVGLIITCLFFPVFLHTANKQRRIFVTLLMVALSYFLCEHLGCSGAISCVVCGLCFSAFREKAERDGRLTGLTEFDDFWETLDVLLNSVLYVILGLTFVRILQMPMVAVLSLASILLNLICRFGSVFAGTWLMGELPDGYGKLKFSALFTWGGLRGGLSIALAMGTAGLVLGDQYNIILGCSYAIVFFTTVVQGLSMKKVYQHLA